MYELRVMEHFKKVPVFNLSDINQIIKSRDYSKKFLKKMVEKKIIFKIKKGMYTLHQDPFLIATYIKKPSYVTGVSALYFHKAITQIPKKIFCATTKNSEKIYFVEDIDYKKTKYFFGFEFKEYDNFKIPIADKEKAIIDSIGITPLHIIEEAVEEIDKGKMVEYLKRIKKSEIVKRIGYLMERAGNLEVYEKLKKYINYKYILLDPLSTKKGEKNKKWSLIIN